MPICAQFCLFVCFQMLNTEWQNNCNRNISLLDLYKKENFIVWRSSIAPLFIPQMTSPQCQFVLDFAWFWASKHKIRCKNNCNRYSNIQELYKKENFIVWKVAVAPIFTAEQLCQKANLSLILNICELPNSILDAKTIATDLPEINKYIKRKSS